MKNRIIMITAFLFVITVGLVFDFAHQTLTYGKEYNQTIIVEHNGIIETKVIQVNTAHYLVFTLIFFVFFIISLSLLIETNNIE